MSSCSLTFAILLAAQLCSSRVKFLNFASRRRSGPVMSSLQDHPRCSTSWYSLYCTLANGLQNGTSALFRALGWCGAGAGSGLSPPWPGPTGDRRGTSLFPVHCRQRSVEPYESGVLPLVAPGVFCVYSQRGRYGRSIELQSLALFRHTRSDIVGQGTNGVTSRPGCSIRARSSTGLLCYPLIGTTVAVSEQLMLELTRGGAACIARAAVLVRLEELRERHCRPHWAVSGLPELQALGRAPR